MTKQILIIDSDLSFTQVVHQTIKALPVSLNTMNLGQAGIKEAIKNEPDLVLLSAELPDMNGFMVCKKLRESMTDKNVPIILTSSVAKPEDFERHRKLKASTASLYLKKPISQSKIFNSIADQLGIDAVYQEQDKLLDDNELSQMVDLHQEPENTGEVPPAIPLVPDNTVSRLEAELNRVREELERVGGERDSYKILLDDFRGMEDLVNQEKARGADWKAQVRKLEEDLNRAMEAETKVAALTEELNTLKIGLTGERDQAIAGQQEQAQRLAETEKELADLKRDAETRAAEIEGKDEEVAALKQSSEAQETNLAAKDEEIAALKKAAELNEAYQATKDEAITVLKEAEAQAAADLAALDREIAGLKEAAAKNGGCLDAKDEEIAALQETIRLNSADLEARTKTLGGLNAEMEKLKNELKAVRQTVHDRETDLQETNASHEDHLKTLNGQIEELNQTIHQIKLEKVQLAEETDARLESQKQALEELYREKEGDLRSSLEKARTIATQHEALLEVLKVQERQQQEEHERAVETLKKGHQAKLDEKTRVSDGRIQELQENLDALTKAHDEATNALDQAQTHIKEQEVQHESAMIELEARYKRNAESLQEQNNAAAITISNLETTLEARDRENARLNDEVAGQKQTLENLQNEHRDQLENLGQEHRNALEVERAEAQRINEENGLLRARLAELEPLEEKYQILLDASRGRDEAYEGLKRKITSAGEHLAAALADLDITQAE